MPLAPPTTTATSPRRSVRREGSAMRGRRPSRRCGALVRARRCLPPRRPPPRRPPRRPPRLRELREHAQRLGGQVHRDRRALLVGDVSPSLGCTAVTSAPPSSRTRTSRKLPRKTRCSTSPGSRFSPSLPCASMRTRSGRIIALTTPVRVDRALLRAQRDIADAQHAGGPVATDASAGTRFETPRKSATKSVAGSSYISCGGPLCSTRPPFMTATRSLIVSASS